MNEIFEYAKKKFAEACDNGEAADINYWNGYLDGIRACMRAKEC